MKKAIKLIALSLVLVMAVLALASCAAPNADPAKAKETLEKNGYSVQKLDGKISTTAISTIVGEDVDCVITAEKIDKEAESLEILCVLYFEDAEDANDAWEKAKEYADSIKEKSEDAAESDWVVDKSGKMIWFGTKNAVKAAA